MCVGSMQFFTVTSMIQIWDARSGQEEHSFQHNHIVKSVAFNPQGNLLVTGSNEKIIRIFDLQRPDAGKVLTLFQAFVAIRNA